MSRLDRLFANQRMYKGTAWDPEEQARRQGRKQAAEARPLPDFYQGLSSKQVRLSAANDGRRDAKAGLTCEPAFSDSRYVDSYTRAYARQKARQGQGR